MASGETGLSRLGWEFSIFSQNPPLPAILDHKVTRAEFPLGLIMFSLPFSGLRDTDKEFNLKLNLNRHLSILGFWEDLSEEELQNNSSLGLDIKAQFEFR